MPDYRVGILNVIENEFIGPCPAENPTDEGEEIIEGDSPLKRYSVAILYPKDYTYQELPPNTENELSTENNDGSKADGEDPEIEIVIDEDLKEAPEDDPVNLSNSFLQSAVSLTVKLSAAASTVDLDVRFGTYQKENIEQNGKKLTRYKRAQKSVEVSLEHGSLPSKTSPTGRNIRQLIYSDAAKGLQLLLVITNRESKDPITEEMFTFSLVNESKPAKRYDQSEVSFFQVELKLSSSEGFEPLPETVHNADFDEDYRNNLLLYRDQKAYAVGHGCASSWSQNADSVTEIKSSFIPQYEVRPIIPDSRQIDFDMLQMSRSEKRLETLATLNLLCKEYSEWISGLEASLENLEEEFHASAVNNAEGCRACLRRMVSGVKTLESDDTVFEAFNYMNEVMLLQQLHYRLPLAYWEGGSKGKYEGLARVPELQDESTWNGNFKYGKWRAFQIAFILMNLQSMRFRDAEERMLIDVIWFPTGGGKTEAYLGLSAYALFVRRLMDKNDDGVTIIMRYTLRLLTTQQFERSASLICACEVIRERLSTRLGDKKFSIGLWVGQSATPNNQKDALSDYRNLLKDPKALNPFVLLKCPWCGAQMGPIARNIIKGYRQEKAGSKTVVRHKCENPECHFNGLQGKPALPIYVVDEDIYRERPSLLIGTVDKFAALSYEPKTRLLFGRGEHLSSPPDLIIQDELHLISGPLGSMVGFFETLISELCKRNDGTQAKIIGSTATISHAKEQCSALYGVPKSQIQQFPPSGLSAKDSFFAKEDSDLTHPGRLYAGLCSPGCSMTMSAINLLASLLISVDEDEMPDSVKDGYWTNLVYFNSLRELGQAATWISGNIKENIETMKRRRWFRDPSRDYGRSSVINHVELTSRISSSEIPSHMQKLSIPFSSNKTGGKERAVDICLATNMISVGVDISRLALMTVDGQPKTTSEYIQATSRVGRGDNPGLVVTLYSPNKARDKSHYEDFQRYHSRLYCRVEPTSVTPFSPPLRDRALKAVLVGLTRYLTVEPAVEDPQVIDDAGFNTVREILRKRVCLVDSEEMNGTMQQLDDAIQNWLDRSPQRYSSPRNNEITPLVKMAGSAQNPNWSNQVWDVPTSMRSVDATCTVKGVFSYQAEVEDE